MGHNTTRAGTGRVYIWLGLGTLAKPLQLHSFSPTELTKKKKKPREFRKLVQRWPRRAASLEPCSTAPSPPPSPPASRYEAPSACPRNLLALRGLASFFSSCVRVLTLRLDGLLACSALLKPDGAQAPRGRRRRRQLPPPGLLLLLLRVPGQRPARQASSGSHRYGRWLCLAGGCPVSPGARQAGSGSRGLWLRAAACRPARMPLCAAA